MDPTANANEQTEIVNGPFNADADDRLLELRSALDEWLHNGGFAPADPAPTLSAIRRWRRPAWRR
jgi:hypothetical protein